MKTAAFAGIVLGLLVAGWTLVMGFTGWYKDPALSSASFAVVLIQIVVLIVTLATGLVVPVVARSSFGRGRTELAVRALRERAGRATRPSGRPALPVPGVQSAGTAPLGIPRAP